MFPLELLADLPEPRDDEPASLRIDIVDELTDHLHCAFRREVLKDGDEAAARRRTLDRFGDPKQIARRLWWQAMWSRIMRQRIVSALQWSVAVIAMLIAGAVFHQQSQMLAEMRQARQEEAVRRQDDAAQRQALTAKLDQLQLQARAPDPAAVVPTPTDPVSITLPPDEANDYLKPMRPAQVNEGHDPELRASIPAFEPSPNLAVQNVGVPRLTVKLVQGAADGPPYHLGVEQIRVNDSHGGSAVADPMPANRSVPATAKTPVGTAAADGVGAPVTYGFFGALEPGHYELVVTLSDGQHSRRPVLIRDDKPQDLTIVCPAPRQKASLQISVPPLPEDLREVALYLDVMIAERPVILDDVEWQPASVIGQALTFDPKTAKAVRLTREDPLVDPSDQRIDLRRVKPEDCLVFVDSGAIALGFQLGLAGPVLSPGGPRNVYPVQFPEQPPLPDSLLRTAQPGENRWQLELPDAFLAEARERLKSLPSNDRPVYDAPAAPAPPPVSAPKTPQLTIKCVPEHADGPAVKVQLVTIRSAEVEAGADRIFSGDDELYAFASLPPDQYELTVVLADSQNQVCTQPLLIVDEKPRELKIVCPGPRKKVPVQLTLHPLPEKLLNLNFAELKMTAWSGPVEIGKSHWASSNLAVQTITFDARSGLPRAIDIENAQGKQQHFDLSELPEDERRVFLPVGTIVYHFRMHERLVGSRGATVFPWPKSQQEEDCLKRVIQGDEKSWKIELPQEYFDGILSELRAEQESIRGNVYRPTLID